MPAGSIVTRPLTSNILHGHGHGHPLPQGAGAKEKLSPSRHSVAEFKALLFVGEIGWAIETNAYGVLGAFESSVCDVWCVVCADLGEL